MQVALDRGEASGRTAEAQLRHHRRIPRQAGLLIGERPPEVQPTAVALQRLGPLQGEVVAIEAPPLALLLLEDMEL